MVGSKKILKILNSVKPCFPWILESQEKDFDEGDFRKKIKNKDGNVIHVNLNRIKPKGNG